MVHSKKFKCVLYAALISAVCGCQADGLAEAVAYNNAIVSEQHKVVAAVEALRPADGDSEARVHQALANLQTQTSKSLALVESLEVPAGAGGLHAAAVELFRFYERASAGAYPKIARLLVSEPYTEVEQGQLVDVLLSLEPEQQALDSALLAEQRQLAATFGQELLPAEL